MTIINHIKRKGYYVYIFTFICYYVLAIFIISGCSAPGMDFTEPRTIAITKPPYQIIISGDLKGADKKAITDLVHQLSKYNFEEYTFNEKIMVSVSGSETEKIQIGEITTDEN